MPMSRRAAWLVAAAERGDAGTFNAVGPAERLLWRPMLERCREALGSKARLTWVPHAFLARQGVEPWRDLPGWVPASESGLAAISNARAVARGLRFRPVADTARDTLAWWRAEPADRRAKLRAGLSPARERAVLEAWKAR